ncbi:MAG TPA: TonB family protein [Gemmatimonadaceae bacterium]
MLNVLMESRVQRQRRAGGAALSGAIHLALIGAVTATAVHGHTAPAPKPTVMVQLRYAPPVVRTPALQPAPSSAPSTHAVFSAPQLPRVSFPTVTPTELPSIDAGRGFSADSISAPDVPTRGSGSIARGLTFGEDGASSSNNWGANEVLMHVLTPARPRYPESLRQAGVGGQVLVRFAVDTTGRIDMASVQFLSSTHDLFTRAVRDALVNFRFRPAEVGGRKVAAMAEMPFEFSIQR